MNINLSLVIVNYNTSEFIKLCLDSIISFTNGLIYEVIVVDNNSSDRDIDKLPDIYRNVKFFFLNTNNGFGSGCNYGATKANGKYVVFINPDVIFTNNALFQLYQFMENNPQAGLSSCSFSNDSGNLTYTFNKFPGIYWEIIQNVTVGKFYVRKLMKKLRRYDELNIPFEVDWLYGACMFTRLNLFKEIGGFDETMFLYNEDVDLQYRIKKIGFKIFCIPYIHVIHFVNSSVKSFNGKIISDFHYHRSKMIYFYKHKNSISRNIIRLINIFSIFFRILYLPFNSKYKNLRKARFAQYIIALKLYSYGKKSLLKSKLLIKT